MRRVLIADDSPIARRLILERLEQAGIDHVVEADSRRAASACDASRLSCALLDLDLGDGTGTDVALELRQTTPALPVAFFTASATEAVRADAATLGPVFEKPHGLDQAIAWILRADDD